MEGKHILVIDDQQDLVDALVGVLEFKKFKTSSTSNSTEGVSMALNEHPDLILLDVQMPGLTGFDVIRKIREDEWGKTAKILLLTASATPESIPEDLHFDSKDFLTKAQWGLENIIEKITEKLSE